IPPPTKTISRKAPINLSHRLRIISKLRRKTISHAKYGFNETRSACVISQFGAQIFNVLIDHTFIPFISNTLRGFNQLQAGERLTGMKDKRGKDIKFGG